MRIVLMVAVAMCGLSVEAAPQSFASAGQRMAATVLAQWPAGRITTIRSTGQWGYEEGVLLDGMAAEWHATADGADFAYLKTAVDKYILPDGSIAGYKVEAYSLDDIELGRAVLLVYRVTRQAKYAKSAQFLHDQLAVQPRTTGGGYWHKQIYPNQMWLDGAYMAEPFRAEYAATFHTQADWTDIAAQLLRMDRQMRDAKTGLLRHGWDESKQMAWADKTTGLSPEAWARADGWYAMALVDVLDWFPRDHPQRLALEEALRRTMAAVAAFQDPATGLWWQVMDKGAMDGNYLEASASCMFTYALAKGVRMGLLPPADDGLATRAWAGIQKRFVAVAPDGSVLLHGTVKVGGLGGDPYRAGDARYYIHEAVGDQDPKGVGAYLMAASEMEQVPTATLGLGSLALIDGWFNAQRRPDALGGATEFHYKWDDDSNEGEAFFGYAFERYGVRLGELDAAPTPANLKAAQIYVLVSPDNLVKNPQAHWMDQASGDAIEAWVKAGGVLLLFSNDRDNSEFVRFNTLSDRFGMHFNPVLSHHVVEPDHGPGEVPIPAGTGIFGDGWTAYMKDTSTITVGGNAHVVVVDHGEAMVAVAAVGKGTVLGVADPWFYNEYADGRKMEQYRGFEAATDVAAWAVQHSRR